FLTLTITVLVPTKETVVISLLTPGPRRRKLWMFDLSATVIEELPGLIAFKGWPSRFMLIVNPGPTVPVSLGSAVFEAFDGATTTSVPASAPSNASVRNRVMQLLPVVSLPARIEAACASRSWQPASGAGPASIRPGRRPRAGPTVGSRRWA